MPDLAQELDHVLRQLKKDLYETLLKQGHVERSLEILAGLIEELANNEVQKLHFMNTYGACALQSHAYNQMQGLFQS